jgi:hypothetical protein
VTVISKGEKGLGITTQDLGRICRISIHVSIHIQSSCCIGLAAELMEQRTGLDFVR